MFAARFEMPYAGVQLMSRVEITAKLATGNFSRSSKPSATVP
jgi:hypothetical protein